MKLIIIRHSETSSNKKGEMQGYHKDSAFTVEGERQVQMLIHRLKSEDIRAVFCSDLGRSFKTADTIARDHHLKPVVVKDLCECNIGIWRDLPAKDAIARWVEYYELEKKKGIKREDIRPPQGENSFDHQKRVMFVVQNIIKDFSQGVVVIVGHSGTNKVIIGSLQKSDPDDFYKVHQSNACVNIAEINGDECVFLCIDDITHLEV